MIFFMNFFFALIILFLSFAYFLVLLMLLATLDDSVYLILQKIYKKIKISKMQKEIWIPIRDQSSCRLSCRQIKDKDRINLESRDLIFFYDKKNIQDFFLKDFFLSFLNWICLCEYNLSQGKQLILVLKNNKNKIYNEKNEWTNDDNMSYICFGSLTRPQNSGGQNKTFSSNQFNLFCGKENPGLCGIIKFEEK